MNTRSNLKTNGIVMLPWLMLWCFINFFSSPVFATSHSFNLNENCVISILNRTVQAQADGNWLMPNVPSFLGQVRARAACVENGVTTVAQSDYFSIIVNDTIQVGTMTVGDEARIPVSLTFSHNGAINLFGVGSYYSLRVFANFRGGSRVNVTAASNGTNYSSANPTIASIDENGLIEAHAAGSVLISARKDGVLVGTMVTISTGNDADNDGLPDEFELAIGLNPRDPIDAQEDIDKDGLTALEEFTFGTLINEADTDSDGIFDGEEIVIGADGFISDPLSSDGDGDGLSDSLEIFAGSDPLNAGDTNIAGALDTIVVTPDDAVITFNTVYSEAKTQLQVVGNLLDGTTINLTDIPGINFVSSDLTVASFGLKSGEIFAGVSGNAFVDVSFGGFFAQARITVNQFSPEALTYIALSGSLQNVDAEGNFAYVAAGGSGLHIVDISNPSSPILVSTINTPGFAVDVIASGDLVYVADQQSGLQIIDVSDPTAPFIIGSLDTVGSTNDLALLGTYVLIADGSNGFLVVDVSNPSSPVYVNGLSGLGVTVGVAVENNLAVVVQSNALYTIDLTDITNPVKLGSIITSGIRDVAINDSHAHVAAYTNGHRVIDVSNPASPLDVANIKIFYPVDVALDDKGLAFFAEILFISATPYVNISTPNSPIYQGFIDYSAFGDYDGNGVDVEGNYVFMTTPRGRLYTAQYRFLDDTNGIPPIVSITSPVEGTEFIEGQTINIQVSASDDVFVAAVNFEVNGIVVLSDTTAPYEFSFTSEVGITGYSIGAYAVDLAGNIGSAVDVVVTSVPDPLTTVNGNVLDENQVPLSGISVSTVGDRSSTSVADGSFSIIDVPTIQGDIVVIGNLDVPDGRVIQGRSIEVTPNRGGVTFVGDINISSCSQQPAGAISWWSLDEALGATAVDVISGQYGILTETTAVNGKILGARRLVLNDIMTVPGNGPLDISGNQVTIEAWIKLENNPTTAQVFTGILGKQQFPNRQAFLFAFESGPLGSSESRRLAQNQWQLEYILTNTSGFRAHNQNTNIIITVDGKYHHFAMTYDGSLVKLYVDGELRGTYSFSGNLKSIPSEPFKVLGSTPFSVDEMSVYSRGLIASEIRNIYLAGMSGAGLCLPVTGANPVLDGGELLLYYPFNGNANDETGNGNHGIIGGLTTTNNVLAIGDNAVDYLSVPYTVVDGVNDFTFSANLKIDSIHLLGNFPLNLWVSGSRSGMPNALLVYYKGNQNRWRIKINDEIYNFDIDNTMADGISHHVAITRSMATARLFIDGEEIGSGIQVDSSALSIDQSGLVVGQEQDSVGGSFSSNQSWAGEIDNLRFYNRALSSSEMVTIYNEDNGN